MKIFAASSLLLLAFALPSASAATLNVPSAYPTIASALAAAALSGDTILVAPGTYREHNLFYKGKAVWLKSSAGAASTIIDGGLAGTIVTMDMGETSGAILEGFTIQNGSIADNRPGGCYIRGSTPIIRNNIFKNNRSGAADGSTGTGGAICVVAGSTGILGHPTITGNTFTGNTSGIDGGAIYLYNSGAEITFNTFTGNIARPTGDNSRGSGGAIQANRTPGPNVLNINHNTFQNNKCQFAGGAISVFAMAASISYNQILNNDGGIYAGGIHLETQDAYGSFPYNVVGNTISANKATNVGGGLHTYMQNTTSTVNVTGNTITNNTCLEPTATSFSSPETASGGGVGCFEGKGLHTFRANYIAGNRGDNYGGVLLSNMPVVFNKNRVVSNRARFSSGGVHLVGNPMVEVTQNVFTDNSMENPSSSVADAGGLRIKDCADDVAVIANNVFDRNTGQQGGGATIGTLKQVMVYNNTFLNNTSRDAIGGSLYIDAQGSVNNNIFFGDTWGLRVIKSLTFLNNDFYQNTKGLMQHFTANFTSVTTLNATTFADNNLDLAPGFTPTTSGNFHLTKTSPLINRGVAVPALPDIDNDPRPLDGLNDLGADEFVADQLGLRVAATFYLDVDGNFILGGGDATAAFGFSTDVPVVGDWNGDGVDTIGVWRAGVFYLRNSNTAGSADVTVTFGSTTGTPITGDWDGDGIDTIGLKSGNVFSLRNSNDAGGADLTFAFGATTAVPLVGDFDSDGRDTIAVRAGNVIYVKNKNDSSAFDFSFTFGAGSELATFGDWDGDGIDSLGLYTSSTGSFGLRFNNTSGSADASYGTGKTGAIPFAVSGAGLTATAAFFNGEVTLGNGVYYLAFQNGTPFGYYSYLADPNYIYHFDLGYLYIFDAADGQGGVYFYDFTSAHFFYTSPTFPFPYLYDFTLGAVLYYYPDSSSAGHYTTNPRYFYNTSTRQIFTQ